MLRHFRLYRILRVGWAIVVVALRYWWLGKRDAPQPKWDRAHRKTGEAIYTLATTLGGALVKLGQVHGARADVLPAPFIEPLRGLHDRVPARPLSKLKKHVERELGRPIDEVFASIEPVALAAASLAQVHKATLKDGTPVVVKIQYPEARRLFPIDMGSLRRAVRVARWLNKKLDLRPLANELAEFVTLELDFAREARSTERVRANLAGDPDIVVPKIFTELSTDKLLVLEFLSGTPLSKAEVLREKGVDLRDVARRVAGLYAKMIFGHGFFHGDPHPGNILVLDDGRLALLDFGLAKELPEGFAASTASLLASAMRGDSERALAAAQAMGFQVPDGQVATLLGVVRMLMGDYKDSGAMTEAFATSRIGIPTHFTLIGRVMIILSGVSHTLVPGEKIIPAALLAALAPHLVAKPAA
ncbi:MAG: AarF/ABC1/UbiB kinase family protein [Myxococcales bacterium]|nr:AarF/ABC1/UbiB kinase family protein [Myxococcales bacterium]